MEHNCVIVIRYEISSDVFMQIYYSQYSIFCANLDTSLNMMQAVDGAN